MDRNGHIDAEWRTIEEFPQYEMNEDKQVRHISGRVRSPQFNGRHYYSFSKDGKNYSRSVASLYRATFPDRDHSELPKRGRPRGTVKVRPKIADATQQEIDRLRENRLYRIESFPEYGINKKGEVYNLASGVGVTPSNRDGLSVHLRKDGKWHFIAVRTLLRRTFGS
jgi:hypothetical protein